MGGVIAYVTLCGTNVFRRLYILAGVMAAFALIDRSRTQLLPHTDPAHVRPAAH